MSQPDSSSGRPDAAPYVYLLTTMALFGTAFTSSKVVVGQMPHDVAAALRFGGGAVVLLVVHRLRAGPVPFAWRDLLRAGLVGLIGVSAYNFLFFWGLSQAPAIDGSILVPVLSPVLTTFALLAAGQEKASALRMTGLMVGVAGAVVFLAGVAGTGGGLTASRLAGDVTYLFAAGCWAAYTVASKKLLNGIEPLRATTYATAVGALALIVIAIPSAPDTNWTSLSATTWANVAFLAIGPTAVAYLFYAWGLRAVSPVTATVMMFAVPFFGILSAVLVLGESFTPLQILGASVTTLGAVLAVCASRPGRPDSRARCAPAPSPQPAEQRQ